MAHLSISVLGPLRITLDTRPLAVPLYDKAYALLVYLALEAQRSHRREELADLLWPELAAGAARLNLRQSLFALRRALQDQEATSPFLLVERHTLRFNPNSDHWLDAAQLAAPLPSCGATTGAVYACVDRIENVLEGYRGAFLHDLALPGCVDFESWVVAKREMLHQRALTALERLSMCLEKRGDIAQALNHAQRYVELEPWDEGGHRRVMRLLAANGEVEAAIAQYATCHRILEHELGTAPDEVTERLLMRIRSGTGNFAMSPVALTGVICDDSYDSAATPATHGARAVAERRQVTALYCELAPAGSADPEDVGEMLREPQRRVADTLRQGGGYVRPIHGGGIIAYFGYPSAHEDAARQAVHAALSIAAGQSGQSEQTAPVRIKVGVHTGLIITHDMPELLDAAGITSRAAGALCDLARQEEVLISDSTLRLVEGYFEVEPLGRRAVRNLSCIRAAYRVRGKSGATHRLAAKGHARLTPLVGREAEVEQLLAHWQEARSDNLHTVLISGEAGIGKSRLVHSIKERLADVCALREIQCQPQFQGSALYPVIELMQRLAGFEPGDSAQDRAAKLKHYLQPFFTPSAEVMALLAPLLGLPPGASAAIACLSPKRRKEMTQQALLGIAQARASQLPTLWIVEDLHWADPSTLELIGLVMARARGASILGLLTARPEFKPPWEVSHHILLDRLSATDTGRMIEWLAGERTLPVRTIADITRAADGVPLFIEEMTRAALEPVGADEHLHCTVPATLHDLLMARLDRLGHARPLAQLAATLGREFSEELLAAVAPIGPAELRQALRTMVEGQLLNERETGAGRVYQFKHALFQEAAYQSQLKRDRQAAHHRIAGLLTRALPDTVERQPELLAQHLTGAGRARQAIDWWLRAGERALARHASLEAIAHLDTSLALLDTLPAGQERDRLELDLQLARGASLLNVKGYGATEVQQAYGRAMALCRESGETGRLFHALWGLFMGASTRSGYPEAKEIAQQMLGLAEAQDDPELRIGAHYAMGNTLFWTGEFAEAMVHQQCAVAAYAPQYDEALILRYGENPAASSLAFMGWSLWFLGYPDRALAKAREAVAFARSLADPPTLALTLTFAAMLHRLRHEPPEVQAVAEEVLALADSGELTFWKASGLALHGWARVMQGGGSGIDSIEQSLEGMRQAMGGAGVSFLAVLAEACKQLRQPEAGLTALDEARVISEAVVDRYFEAELHRLKGELLLMLPGNHETAAEACFRQALTVSRQQSARMLELRAAASLARLHLGQGRMDTASELAKVYSTFTEGFATTDLTVAKALLQGANPSAKPPRPKEPNK
jgi:DNA-binding SARP family transcriptional activator/class 3 adenylate cyclase/predicted ATPase